MTFSELIKSKSPVLVDFSATWCGPCKMMNEELKTFKKQMGDAVTVVKVDVDKNPAAANHYNVRGVPTLILFREGDILWQQSGVVRAPQLKSIVDGFMAAAS